MRSVFLALGLLSLVRLAPAPQAEQQGPSRAERFLWHVKAGELETVRTMLAEDGALANATNGERTPLVASLRAGHIDIARLLLRHGADPDATDGERHYEGPLHLAAREAHLDALNLLIEHGADINLLDSEGRPPLALTNDPNVDEMLSRNGAVRWRVGADLADAGIDPSRLQDWGERRYRVQRLPRFGSGETEVREMGTITLVTEITARGPLLRDFYDLELGSDALRAVIAVTTRTDAWLSPTRLECDVETGGEIESFAGSFAGTTATLVRGGREFALELPAGTVTLEALWRIVTLLPRARGVRFELPHILETCELNLKGRHAITCLGRDEIKPATRQDEGTVACTRYAVDTEHGRVMELWVDDRGVLQRIRIDDYKVADLVP